MKRALLSLALLLLLGVAASSQTVNVRTKGQVHSFKAPADVIKTEEVKLTLNGKTLLTSDIEEIFVDRKEVKPSHFTFLQNGSSTEGDIALHAYWSKLTANFAGLGLSTICFINIDDATRNLKTIDMQLKRTGDLTKAATATVTVSDETRLVILGNKVNPISVQDNATFAAGDSVAFVRLNVADFNMEEQFGLAFLRTDKGYVFPNQADTMVLEISAYPDEDPIQQIIDNQHNTANSWNSGRADGFGLPSIFVGLDRKGMDFISENTGYNWYSNYHALTDKSRNMGENHYALIFSGITATNNVLISIPATVTQLQWKYNRAQARARRAYYYFILAQLYQWPYAIAKNEPLAPIITEENSHLLGTTGIPLSTVDKVYEFIINELNAAEQVLETENMSPQTKSDLSIGAIEGLKARVYLTKGDYGDALAAAEKAIGTGDATPLSLAEVGKPGFNDINAENWLWGIDITEEDAQKQGYINTFASHTSTLSNGYCTVVACTVNENLYNQISSTDERKKWFLDEDGNHPTLEELYPGARQFMQENNNLSAYTEVKFAPYNNIVGDNIMANDIPLMRIEEMYLIKAEALYRTGREAAAREELASFIKTYRDPQYPTPEGDFISEVWKQRRIEFFGEGISYFDILRLQKDIVRTDIGNYPEQWKFDVNHDDDRLIYDCGEYELMRNPAIAKIYMINKFSSGEVLVEDELYEGRTIQKFTITRNYSGVEENIPIQFWTDDPNVLSAPKTVTILENSTSAYVEISINKPESGKTYNYSIALDVDYSDNPAVPEKYTNPKEEATFTYYEKDLYTFDAELNQVAPYEGGTFSILLQRKGQETEKTLPLMLTTESSKVHIPETVTFYKGSNQAWIDITIDPIEEGENLKTSIRLPEEYQTEGQDQFPINIYNVTYEPKGTVNYTSWWEEKTTEKELLYCEALDNYCIKNFSGEGTELYFHWNGKKNDESEFYITNKSGTYNNGRINTTYTYNYQGTEYTIFVVWNTEMFTGYDEESGQFMIPFQWRIDVGRFNTGDYDAFTIKE